MKEPLQSDVPSSSDELKRRPFAERIVQTLVSPDATASLAFGIHAPLGDGKTTVLRLIRELLEAQPKVLCVEFNPWQVENAADFPRALLGTLADAMEEKVEIEESNAHQTLRDYARFFSAADGAPAKPADPQPGRRAGASLPAARTAVEFALAGSGVRVIVLIDDIDRLDAPRLLALIKLLTLTADFPGVFYVLAGDDGVIADTLSSALGRIEAGRELLEKAIQVPLNIPKTDPGLLRDFFLRRLKATLDPAYISVRPDAEARFSEVFIQGLQPRMKTPRTAKRLINALGFALGIVKSRVNTVDLIVVEAIRLLYPNLYRAIRENRDDFLWYRISRDGPDADNRANELMVVATTGLKGGEQEAVHFLVRSLFPAFDRARYPSRGDIERWGDDKRICSPEHFDRFFDYGNA